LISVGSLLKKESFYCKGSVISIRHHEMLILDGTPCICRQGRDDLKDLKTPQSKWSLKLRHQELNFPQTWRNEKYASQNRNGIIAG
jgi:hypothetical protein